MNPFNPIFALVVYVVALATAYLLNMQYKVKRDSARCETIDGLRGFLAIGVFIHHSAVWFQYLQTGSWAAPPSNLYNQLGQTSVSFFFMITAFLFMTKLLHARDQKMNWNALFVSRCFRLIPMYLLSIVVLVLLVFIVSDWQLQVSLAALTEEMLAWGTFTIVDNPSINASPYTAIINAGVVWSLPYEWLFYFSLPMVSVVVFKKVASMLYVTISLVFVLFFLKVHGASPHHLLSFAGGALSPLVMKYSSKSINFNSTIFSTIVLLCLSLILLFSTSSNVVCKFLIIIVFNLIAFGNTVFGILKSSILKLLGEISYSTYLMHGIIIFITLYFYYDLEEAKKMSPAEFCSVMIVVTPLVVCVSFLSYQLIEKPCMNYSKQLAARKIESIK